MLNNNNIREEVQLIVSTHVGQLIELGQQGRLVPTADIVSLVSLSHESTSDKQLRDYVGYILREAKHVCRYARGINRSSRFIHQEDECSTACKAIDVHNQHPNTYPASTAMSGVYKIPHTNCANCNMILPNDAECGFCA